MVNKWEPFDHESFIISMAEAHRENLLSEYFKKTGTSGTKSITTSNRFIFEFFIFNSLYAIDWKNSIQEGTRILLETRELNKQKHFIKFIRPRVNPDQIHNVIQNFIAPFATDNSYGNFKKVPIQWVSTDQQRSGRDFCRYIKDIHSLMGTSNIKGRFFTELTSSLIYITTIRNNIFHGTKPLGDDWDRGQDSRVKLYTSVVGATNSLFFSAMIPDWKL